MTSDDDEWESRELCICHSCHHIRRTRTECREGDSGLPRESPMIGCHEYGSLLIAREDKFDRRGTKRLEEVEILLSWDSVDPIDPIGLEHFYEKVACFHKNTVKVIIIRQA